MRIRWTEAAAALLTVACLFYLAGYFRGQSKITGDYAVYTQTAAAADAEPSSAEADASGAETQTEAETPASSAEPPAEETAAEEADTSGGKLDLNTATQAELEYLPGIGAVKAKAILAYREEVGGFRSVEELDNVSGIGAATMEKVRPYVTVETEDTDEDTGG